MPTGAVCNQAKLDSNIAKCICNNGFRGDNCMIECKGGSSNPCSGHGTCGADGSCTCTLGWTGSACENACPGQDLPCSGHGTCVGINVTGCSVGCYQVSPTSPPLCNCQAGIQGKISYYYGADCSQPGKLMMFTLSLEHSRSMTLKCRVQHAIDAESHLLLFSQRHRHVPRVRSHKVFLRLSPTDRLHPCARHHRRLLGCQHLAGVFAGMRCHGGRAQGAEVCPGREACGLYF